MSPTQTTTATPSNLKYCTRGVIRGRKNFELTKTLVLWRLKLRFIFRPDRFQRKQNKVKLCNLKITGLFLFPHLSRMTAHLQNSMFVKHSQKQGAAICFAVGFNDVVSENAITLTFCLKIRDYDDRAFLRIEEIGSALWSNYPFYPVFLYEYLY